MDFFKYSGVLRNNSTYGTLFQQVRCIQKNGRTAQAMLKFDFSYHFVEFLDDTSLLFQKILELNKAILIFFCNCEKFTHMCSKIIHDLCNALNRPTILVECLILSFPSALPYCSASELFSVWQIFVHISSVHSQQTSDLQYKWYSLLISKYYLLKCAASYGRIIIFCNASADFSYYHLISFA